METIIIILALLIMGMNVVTFRYLLRLDKKMKDAERKSKIHPARRKRERRHVIVKKTHEREIVRVTPTASEFMQQQYKRVAEQYANK
jgi:hypothetical protein